MTYVALEIWLSLGPLPEVTGRKHLPPMPLTPEQQAREDIDRQLSQCGWLVQDGKDMNIMAGTALPWNLGLHLELSLGKLARSAESLLQPKHGFQP